MKSFHTSKKIQTNNLEKDFGDITKFIGEDGKYHYFYKIYNLANNKYYYGIHSTIDIDDNYLGSGEALHNAYRKYGIECFVKHILCFFDNRKSLLQYEKEQVTEHMVNNQRCYNLTTEGVGVAERYDKPSTKGKIHINNKYKNKVVDPVELNQYLEQGWVLGQLHKSNLNKIIIHNSDNDELFIYPEELDKYISEGWFRGGISRNKGKTSYAKGLVWVNNGEICKRVSPEQTQSYIDDGWKYGSIQRYIKGYIHITNEKEDRIIAPENKELLDYFLENGWRLGSRAKHASKTWINKDGKSITIDKKDLQNYLDNGWRRGIIIKSQRNTNVGKVFIYKEDIIKTVSKEDLQNYLDNGWKKGNPKNLGKNHNKGKIRINNGIERKTIIKEDLQKYLDNGWKKGNLKDSKTKGRVRITNGVEERFITKEEFEGYDKSIWKRGLVRGRKVK